MVQVNCWPIRFGGTSGQLTSVSTPSHGCVRDDRLLGLRAEHGRRDGDDQPRHGDHRSGMEHRQHPPHHERAESSTGFTARAGGPRDEVHRGAQQGPRPVGGVFVAGSQQDVPVADGQDDHGDIHAEPQGRDEREVITEFESGDEEQPEQQLQRSAAGRSPRPGPCWRWPASRTARAGRHGPTGPGPWAVKARSAVNVRSLRPAPVSILRGP